MLHSLEKLRGVFRDVSCSSFHFFIFICRCFSFCCCIFICKCSSICCCCSSFTFSFRRHPSRFRGLSPIFILSAQSIAESFATVSVFNHSVIFLSSATVLSGHFLPTGVFYLTLLHRHFNLHLSRLPWELAVLP